MCLCSVPNTFEMLTIPQDAAIPRKLDSVAVDYRVVANHIHTLTVAITNGGKPGAMGHGYVVCRILR